MNGLVLLLHLCMISQVNCALTYLFLHIWVVLLILVKFMAASWFNIGLDFILHVYICDLVYEFICIPR